MDVRMCRKVYIEYRIILFIFILPIYTQTKTDWKQVMLLPFLYLILLPAAYAVDHAICRLKPPVSASRSITSPTK